jgi:hypothetical protein
MSKLPDMSREEEAEFWKTHDATDFFADYEPTTMSRGKRPKHKCTNCGKRLLSHYVDVEVASGWVVMRQMRELYCPDSHESRLAPESQRLVDAIAAVVRLAPQPMLLAA